MFLLGCEFLGMFVSIQRVLMRLFAQFVRGQMIAFAVRGGGCGVGVRCQVVKFGDSIVRALGHVVLLLASMQTSLPEARRPVYGPM